MNRRDFLNIYSLAAAGLGGYTCFPDLLNSKSMNNPKKSYLEYLRKSAVKKEILDVFLNENTWAQFDPELGYVLGNYMPHDGIDNSYTLSTTRKDGGRTRQIYVDKPCRINTYGNSFTQCHQVSDAETWQEYLAGHLGEPIRNFGMGGFGVYQAYRRMVREEQTGHGADYVILYLWGDDYIRSVFRCRYVTYYTKWDDAGGYMFHGNFWSNIEMDLDSGKLVEKPNMIWKREDLYQMTDPDFMVDHLKDDLMIQLHLLSQNMVNSGLDLKGLNRLAEILSVPPVDLSDDEGIKETARRLRDKYSFEATKYILRAADNFTRERGKKLMILHFDPYGVMRPMINGISRYDQEVVDFIRKENLNFFDMNEVHVQDYKKFNLSLEEYMNRYFIGHYNPSGNHFFAYALKDRIVEWLDPKPVTYLPRGSQRIQFEGYLPE
jgi:hypothetical protein